MQDKVKSSTLLLSITYAQQAFRGKFTHCDKFNIGVEPLLSAANSWGTQLVSTPLNKLLTHLTFSTLFGTFITQVSSSMSIW